jgi:hypothetical protein
MENLRMEDYGVGVPKVMWFEAEQNTEVYGWIRL